MASRTEILEAIRDCATDLGRVPSRSEFLARSKLTEYQVLNYFTSWGDAVKKAGLDPNVKNVKIDDEALLNDWAAVVRTLRHIPTRFQYKREGKFSLGVFDRHFGVWSGIPDRFKRFAEGNSEWADVVALLSLRSPPPSLRAATKNDKNTGTLGRTQIPPSPARHSKLADRSTYGNPLDFRGLRHEPVNEDGVVFLFGMVARELGYLVEAVQAGFPDCEAKRQVGPGKWQRVRIEFEFESRNFRDHGHPPDGCDLIICWRHNWPECPKHLEVVELCNVISTLSSSEE